jgi:hypothetical protein
MLRNPTNQEIANCLGFNEGIDQMRQSYQSLPSSPIFCRAPRTRPLDGCLANARQKHLYDSTLE